MGHEQTTGAVAVAAAERRARCLAGRRDGLTYRAIAEREGCSVAAVHKAVTRALAELPKESGPDVLAMELARLDRWQENLLDQIEAGDHGAIALALKISERRSKLLGLKRIAVEMTGEIRSTGASVSITMTPDDLKKLDATSLTDILDRLGREE